MLADRQSRLGGILNLGACRRGGFVGKLSFCFMNKSEKGNLVMTPRTHGVHSLAT
jgi:hypothetical protein